MVVLGLQSISSVRDLSGFDKGLGFRRVAAFTLCKLMLIACYAWKLGTRSLARDA